MSTTEIDDTPDNSHRHPRGYPMTPDTSSGLSTPTIRKIASVVHKVKTFALAYQKWFDRAVSMGLAFCVGSAFAEGQTLIGWVLVAVFLCWMLTGTAQWAKNMGGLNTMLEMARIMADMDAKRADYVAKSNELTVKLAELDAYIAAAQKTPVSEVAP